MLFLLVLAGKEVGIYRVLYDSLLLVQKMKLWKNRYMPIEHVGFC